MYMSMSVRTVTFVHKQGTKRVTKSETTEYHIEEVTRTRTKLESEQLRTVFCQQ